MTPESVLNDKNEEGSRAVLHQIVNLGVDFKLRHGFAADVSRAQNLETLFSAPMPEDGKALPEVVDEFAQNILPGCVNFSDPKFLEFPYAGNSIAAIGADFFKTMLQQNLMTREWSPAATRMEMQVINWLRTVVGFTGASSGIPESVLEAGGISTYGGTLSNTVAMYAASKRAQEMGETKRKLVIVPREIAHYSIGRSLEWLGNELTVVEVDTNDFRYGNEVLTAKLKECGVGNVLAVVAFAGDSKAVCIDDFDSVQSTAKTFDPGIWLHADACHGFCLAFSNRLKGKLKGIEQFDSISADPHKDLFAPYPLSFLLFRNSADTKYLCEGKGMGLEDDEQMDFGRITPFIGSKSWESLKFWFLAKNLGRKGIGELVDVIHDRASQLSDLLAQSSRYFVFRKNDFNSVLFSCRNNSEDNLNTKANEQVLADIQREGIYALRLVRVNDRKDKVLKAAFGNPNFSEDDVKQLVAYLEQKASNFIVE